ncbi:MAG: dUTP diphosphatase [Gammaproteobacteria bacterium]
MTATLRAKTSVMLALQDEMNRRVDADWLSFDREWYRAIWIECAELMDHYGGWKWWKHSERDLAQVVLEIVDIWHFGLSMHIDEQRDYDAAAAVIAAAWEAPPAPLDFLEEVERLAATALAERRFAVGAVRNLLEACGLGFDDLYRSYVAKNVLNLFRQDHGYRDGSYRKQWQGREDNEVLAELMATLDLDREDLREALLGALEERYAAALRV